MRGKEIGYNMKVKENGYNMQAKEIGYNMPVKTPICGQRNIDPVKLSLMMRLRWVSSTSCPRSGELRTQKLKSRLMRTQSLKVLLLKPGVGQYIAMHATLTARDFLLANFYSSGPLNSIFSKPLPSFSCVSCG